MKRIIAIGGGEICLNETLLIDKTIVGLCKKSHPKLLFVPTASGDSEIYINTIKRTYGNELGCEVDVLKLLDGETNEEDAKEKILSADIIYIGGGNTRKMMVVWKLYGIDKALYEAYDKELLLCGLSAGAICWFKKGHSEATVNEVSNEFPYTKVNGLGIINAIYCPHYNDNHRKEDFDEMVLNEDHVGIAVENNCAIEFTENRYRVIKSVPDAKAFKIFKNDGVLIHLELKNEKYEDLGELLDI